MLLEVAIERLHDLGLRAVALDDDRQGLEPGERRVERRVADASGLRLGADAAQPLVERRRQRRHCRDLSLKGHRETQHDCGNTHEHLL
jgi:hypothetical protein